MMRVRLPGGSVAGESKDSSSPAIPYSGIVGALMVVAAVVAQHAKLDSARPAPVETNGLVRSAHQDVEARLWQDPIAAVAQFRERGRKDALQESQLRRLKDPHPRPSALPPDDDHSIEGNLKGYIRYMKCHSDSKLREPVRLLMPMLIVSRDEESAEMRRRTRYAVVSGLMNADYNPDDPDAIGYVHVPLALRGKPYESTQPETMPFEWFRRPQQKDPDKNEWVLVLWLDQAVYQEAPLAQLRALVDLLAPACMAGTDKGDFDATVIGPVDSEMLVRMDKAIKAERRAEMDALSPRAPSARAAAVSRTKIRVVSASATAPLTPSQFFFDTPSGGAVLARVIGPDDALINGLRRDLKLRLTHYAQVGKKKPVVAVVGEHDTGYGRDFAVNMAKGALSGFDYPVVRYSYLRQIDGGRGGAQRRQKSADRDKEEEKAQPQPQNLRSHGPYQIDYLDRMVRDIEHYSEEENKDVVAIGIFGNDVYDKLLLLRALRPAFPKALFFTTDIDARLLDADEAKWARNLIVATNFGLTLGSEVQRGTAPFRDGYQAATYFAAWLYGGDCALQVLRDYGADNKVPPWVAAPLIFEIGRHRPIPIEGIVESKGGVDLSKCRFGEAGFAKPTEVRVQPVLKRPELPGTHMAVVALLAATILWQLVAWASRHPVWPEKGATRVGHTWKEILGIYATLLAGCIAVGGPIQIFVSRDALHPLALMLMGIVFAIGLCLSLWSLSHGYYRGRLRFLFASALLAAPAVWLIPWAAIPAVLPNEEPFTWVEGVSVWPTQLLRLAAAMFGGFALWYMGAASLKNMRRIADDFHLVETGSGPDRNLHRSMAGLWVKYEDGRSLRIGRTILASMAYFAACFLLMLLLDARPGMPVRGDGALQLSALLGFDIFLGIALLVGVMFGCHAFIYGILKPAVKSIPWFPEARVADFRGIHGLPESPHLGRFIDCCLMVEVAVARSEMLMNLIYAPFAMFALMVVARSSLFDNWDTPFGLVIVLGLPFLFVVGCMVWLRVATMKMHRKAIRKAQQRLIRMKGEGMVEAHVWQLDKLLDRLRDEKRGSFQNILLQPMFRALLFPLGGISGIELLEQFVLNR